MNPNSKEFLKSCESFLRKSQFSTLTNLNPGIGDPGTHTRFQKFFSIWVPMHTKQDWKAKLESAYSFIVKLVCFV